MIEQYEAGGDTKLQSPRPYGLGLAHKHIPEMMVQSGLRTKPVFMPIVSSFYKGLAVTIPLHLKDAGDAERIHAAYARRYEGERFVRVMPLDDAATLADGFFVPQRHAGAADGATGQPGQGRQRRSGAVHEPAPGLRRRSGALNPRRTASPA